MRRLILPIFTLLILGLATIAIIAYGRGYRFNPKEREVRTTGLLVATSEPDGAQIYIDGVLTSATNTTLSLSPGTYSVKITKEGYLSWQKTIPISAEVVAETDAILFPANPSLSPLTTQGAHSPAISPQRDAIAFVRRDPQATVSAGRARENILKKTGVFILDLSNRPLSFSRNPRQILSFNDLPITNYQSQTTLVWSPDAKELLAVFTNASGQETVYLLDTTNPNSKPKYITTIAETLALWEEEKQLKLEKELASLPKELAPIATASAQIINFSPDESKILYRAKKDTTIPPIIKPPLIGTNPTEQERTIKTGSLYVYDIKEDRNYLLPQIADSQLKWFPTSRHLLYTENNKIKIMEYDGVNKTTLYAGPFESDLIIPWPNGSKLVILTTLNPDASKTLNLYAVKLR